MKKSLFITLLALSTLQITGQINAMDANLHLEKVEGKQSPTKKREAGRILKGTPSPKKKACEESPTGLTPEFKKVALKHSAESSKQKPVARKIDFDSVATPSSQAQAAAAAVPPMSLDPNYTQTDKSKPTVIFLNGTSSVGKSSIAIKFVSLLEEYEFVSMDELIEAMESQVTSLESKLNTCKNKKSKRAKQLESERAELEAKLEESTASFTIEKVSEKIAEGSSVICDIVITDKEDFEAAENLKHNANVFIMLVYCPIDIVIQRVIARNQIADGSLVDDSRYTSDASDTSDVSDDATTQTDKRKLYQVLEGLAFIYSFTPEINANVIDKFDPNKFAIAIKDLKGSGNFDEENDQEAINRYISPEKPFFVPIYQGYDLVLRNYSHSAIEKDGDAKVSEMVKEILNFLVLKNVIIHK